MTHTIHLTTHQAHALRHVITQCIGMAHRSPTVALVLNIDPIDLARCQSVIDSLPKPPKNGGDIPAISGDLQPKHPPHRANHTPATVATAGAAHADNRPT